MVDKRKWSSRLQRRRAEQAERSGWAARECRIAVEEAEGRLRGG